MTDREQKNEGGEETWQKRALHRYYHRRPNWRTGTERFREVLSTHLGSASQILEIGAGPSNPTSRFLAEFGEVTGVDLDSEVETNDACTRAWVYDGRRIPAESGSFDAVVSNYVLEHVADPMELCVEAFRVLRPGGVMIFRTPNLWHYVSLIARITPHSIHERIALRAQSAPEGAHDPYPTLHRMNTRAACRRLLEASHFEVLVLNCIEGEPSYGLFSRLAFYPMMIWERVLNATDLLEDLRSNIFCVARKRP